MFNVPPSVRYSRNRVLFIISIDLTIFAIQAKGPDGKWTRKPLANRESNNVHLLVTRPPEICVNLVRILVLFIYFNYYPTGKFIYQRNRTAQDSTTINSCLPAKRPLTEGCTKQPAKPNCIPISRPSVNNNQVKPLLQHCVVSTSVTHD